MNTELFSVLRKHGWHIENQNFAPFPVEIQNRYPALPEEISLFLGTLRHCHNATESAWFLTPDDVHLESFPWNSFERMSLQNAESQSEKEVIQNFWSVHFPFLLCVHSDYDYLAVCLSNEGFGSIVHGFAPYWEEPGLIAPDFGTFLERLTEEARSARPSWPFSLFM